MLKISILPIRKGFHNHLCCAAQFVQGEAGRRQQEENNLKNFCVGVGRGRQLYKQIALKNRLVMG